MHHSCIPGSAGIEVLSSKRQPTHFEELANAAANQRTMLPRPFVTENLFLSIDLHGEMRLQK
jgi:hypothetical protein